MTWRGPFLDLRSGLFIPRLVTWDPGTGEFACVGVRDVAGGGAGGEVPASMTERPAGEPARIFALERYHNWANVMRQHFESQQYEDERKAHWEPYMAAWYGLLYVVVEGWEELGLSNPEIDDILRDDEKKGLLRRYRNGAFHYQPDYFDERFVALWSRDFEATHWIRRLHEAFADWFPRWNESYGRWLDSRRQP